MQAGPLVIYVQNDNPVVEQTLLDFLGDLGNKAVAVRDDDLSEKLKTSDPTPDLLITSLPDNEEGGFELLRQTHQQYPELAVFLITNGGRALSAIAATECGVNAFLREPIRLSELEFYLTRL
jgi:DNA-binding NtrC family response regulator